MNKRRISNIIIGILLAIAIFFVAKKVMSKSETAAAAPPSAPPSAAISAYIVGAQTIENQINANGTFVPSEEVELRPEISGRVVAVNINEGKYVAKGTTIVKLYDEDIKAQMQKIEAQLAIAQKNADRIKQLSAVNGTSQVEVDNAQNQLNMLNADLNIQRLQLQKTEVKAPFSGFIGFKNVSIGAFATNSTVFTTMQQRNPIKFDFNVPEKYQSSIAVGKKVQFTADNEKVLHTATIVALDPRIDVNSRSIRVRAQTENGSNTYTPGAFANVVLDLEKRSNTLMIPTQCIIPEARNKKVMLIKNGKAKPTIVETGIREESQIEITSGLSLGDTILATGILLVRPDMSVKITSFLK